MRPASKLFILLLIFFFVSQLIFAGEKVSDSKNTKPSADEVLKMLKEGNERFYTGKAEYPHLDTERLKLAGTENQGDYALATVISCSDSRVPVELIFDVGIMDLFVIRVAGNVCDRNEIGTIEFGLVYVKTPLLVVMGHTQCAAVSAAVQEAWEKGHPLERNISPLVKNIVPAVKRAMENNLDVHGDDIISYATEENVWQGIENLFMRSPATRNLVKDGKVKVVGTIYDVGTGKMNWLPLEKSDEILAKVEASPDKETELYASE